MFGRKGISEKVTERAEAVVGYVDPLARDERLRTHLAAAVVAAEAARRRVLSQMGVAGAARRIATDPVLRAQVSEVAAQLQSAQRRARKAPSPGRRREILLFLGALGLVAAAIAKRFGGREA